MKNRAKKEKKLQEQREKQEKLLEGMKKKKKEKKEEKEKTAELTKPPSLFQTLTLRMEGISEDNKPEILPFVASKKDQPEEASKLRIIPNIEDMSSGKESGFIPITPDLNEKKSEKTKSQDLLVCKECGAVLSADYAYCNKCGSKL